MNGETIKKMCCSTITKVNFPSNIDISKLTTKSSGAA